MMRIVATSIPGAHVIETEPLRDERGGFARTFCDRTFAAAGLDARVAQCSLSWNTQRGTLRGLHYQRSPHEEAKTVRVVAGAIFDVVVDLRADSPAYARWFGIELTADNLRALHIPPGCAHGFLTLAANSVLHYQMSVPFEADASAGVRWNDPRIAIAWPFEPSVISERDRALPWLPS